MPLKFLRAFACIYVWLVFTGSFSYAQSRPADSLRITLHDAEEQFLRNNLQLIAQRYNIDAASAQIITARLFSNPNFSFSNGIYASGVSNAPHEQTFGLAQLFTTAGKRNKNIQLARINVQQARYQFFDLLRTLRYTLRSDFYNIYYKEQSAGVYTQAITSLTQTLNAFKVQLTKGNIAEKEVLRIQSELYNLENEYNDLQTSIDTTQREFRLLIHAAPATYILPQFASDLSNLQAVTSVPYQRLLDSAYVNRYDLQAIRTQLDYNNVNLKLQKANAVPDLTFNAGYDRLAAYGNNFLGLGVSFDLPFFNRNQGNIQQAKVAIEQSKVQLQNQQNVVESDVSTQYRTALRLEQLANSFDPKFRANFTRLIAGVYRNYQLRNISLLEFLDFYDSYKNNILQSNNLQFNRLDALEQLNFVTGTPFYNQQ